MNNKDIDEWIVYCAEKVLSLSGLRRRQKPVMVLMVLELKVEPSKGDL